MESKRIDTGSDLCFSIERTSKTPHIFLDANRGFIIISGKVLPESATAFFTPVIDFIEEHFRGLEKISCEFSIEYFNSSGSKKILDIFQKINVFFRNGAEVHCKWYYEEDDEDVLNEGEDLQSLVKFPVEIIEIEED